MSESQCAVIAYRHWLWKLESIGHRCDKCMIGRDMRYIRINSPHCYNVLVGRDGF